MKYFMKPILAIIVIAAIAAFASQERAVQPVCGAVRIPSDVEIAAGDFVLSDLLPPKACPALLSAARQVRLGKAPLAGSARVLEGRQVRALCEKLVGGFALESWSVPERITVLRSGNRESCAAIGQRILAELPVDAGNVPASNVECGAASRIPRGAPLEVIRANWDAASRSWEIAARCVHPIECVPFLVRVSDPSKQKALAASPEAFPPAAGVGCSRSTKSAVDRTAGRHEMVRPGQTATLVWDQDGIRVLVPALCLDRGRQGQQVRARLRGGQVVWAIVVSAAELRSVS